MSSLSAASASSRPFFPTKEDIHRKRVELLHLKHTVIPDRRNRKRGRHVKHETSRLIWIDTIGLPNLLRGKLPSAEDEKALNLPHPNATDEDGKQLLTESNRRWMDGKSLFLPAPFPLFTDRLVCAVWSDAVHRHPNKTEELSQEKQKSILSFAATQPSSAYGNARYVSTTFLRPSRTCVVTNTLGKQQPAARCSVVL